MKKLLSLVLTGAMIFSLTITVFADSSTVDLSSLAASNIQISTSTDENGTTKTTYSNLDGFIHEAHSMYPDLSDYEIATFLMDYTGKEYYDLPEEEILHFLTYDNITSTTTYIRVDNEGNAYLSDIDALPYADWSSTDGYMKITTDYSYIKSVGQENYFTVSARATWIKYPAIALEDAFVLGTSGTFDDSSSEYGSVSQTFQCVSGCSKFTTRNRSVYKGKTVEGDLSMEYENFVPALHFTPISPRCDYCSGGSRDYYFSAYIRYGIIADESVNIQAGYAHKTLGVNDISVGIDINGTPSFSASFSTVTSYIARPVTVSH